MLLVRLLPKEPESCREIGVSFWRTASLGRGISILVQCQELSQLSPVTLAVMLMGNLGCSSGRELSDNTLCVPPG